MGTTQRFRIFAQDVGLKGYSCVTDVRATTAHTAVVWADDLYPSWRGKHIALPHDRKDLWPNPTTGCVPPEALTFR